MPSAPSLSFSPLSIVLYLLLLAAAIVSVDARIEASPGPTPEEDMRHRQLNKTQFEKVRNMHLHWHAYTIKALFGQLGREVYKKSPDEHKKKFADCLNVISDSVDSQHKGDNLVQYAKCLVAAKDRVDALKRNSSKSSNIVLSAQVVPQERPYFGRLLTDDDVAQDKAMERLVKKRKLTGRKKKKTTTKTTKLMDVSLKNRSPLLPVIATTQSPVSIRPIVAKRRKGSHTLKPARLSRRKTVAQRQRDRPMSPSQRRPPISSMARAQMLAAAWRRQLRDRSVLRRGYVKYSPQLYRHYDTTSRRRAKRAITRLVGDTVFKSDSVKLNVKKMLRLPALATPDEKTPLERISRLVRTFVRDMNGTMNATMAETLGEGWQPTYERLLEMEKRADKKRLSPGAKPYDFRLYDLVLGNKSPTRSPDEEKQPRPIWSKALDLVNSLTARSPGERRASNMKILSPRFASIMPDKIDVRQAGAIASPSLFSFYKDETDANNIASLPTLMEKGGLADADRKAMLEMVMEISSAKDLVEGTMKMIDDVGIGPIARQMTGMSTKIDDLFTGLVGTFSRKQKRDMRRRGFTYMEPKQMNHIYDEQGIRQHDDVAPMVEHYAKTSRFDREVMLWRRIRRLAVNGTELLFPIPEDYHPGEALNRTASILGRRVKRSFFGPFVLEPLIFAPYMFAPTHGLSILGPLLFAPSLFSPVLLNPSVLSPFILSPAVGFPLILSPYVFGPFILSPYVMAPFILTPYAISPNVLNNYVLAPIILSPIAISPDVMSSMVLAGAVLSPSFLSPSIMSKSYGMVSVLSPGLLS